jgi:dolichol-phosphate mannosyltransferase
MQIFLALPAYNEEQALPGLLERLERGAGRSGHPTKIIIVNDGSTDATPSVLERWSSRLPLQVIHHAENRGLGESIEDALREAAKIAAPEDVIVSMDADNTHSLELLYDMVARLSEGSDVVIASRYRPSSRVVGLSLLRRSMSYGARLLFQVLFPIPGVRDYTSGFRAYRAAVLQRLLKDNDGRLVTERGFACMAEILLRLRAMGVRMCEVPMVLRYDLKGGPSKMNVPRTVLKTLRLAFQNRFSTPRRGRSRKRG